MVDSPQGSVDATRPTGPRVLSRAPGIMLAMILALATALIVVPQNAQAAPAASNHSRPEHRTYVVRKSDNLSTIALRFGVSQDAIMRANNIRIPNVIYVGQVLIIPGAHTPDSGKSPVQPPDHQPSRPSTYVVRSGDTLGDIAKRFNTTVQALMQANNIRNPNRIEVGQVLTIPGQGGKDPAPPAKPPAKPPAVQPGKEPVRPAPAHPPRPEPKKPEPKQPELKQPEPKRPESKPPQSKQPQHPPAHHPPVQHPRPQPPIHKAEPPAKPAGHWVGHYYAGKYFDELVEVRHDPEIRFNWQTGSPGEGMPEDRFSIRWERTEHFQAGWYRFYAVADDGVRVFVDDTLIIDAWHIQPVTEYTADVYLAGGLHQLNVDYFEEAGHAEIHVYYEPLRGDPPVIKR